MSGMEQERAKQAWEEAERPREPEGRQEPERREDAERRPENLPSDPLWERVARAVDSRVERRLEEWEPRTPTSRSGDGATLAVVISSLAVAVPITAVTVTSIQGTGAILAVAVEGIALAAINVAFIRRNWDQWL